MVLLITTLVVFVPLACLKRIDSLRYTYALSVALAVVFLVTAGITIFKLISGSIMMPRLLPEVNDFTSVFKLFTVVTVLVTAYICHYNVYIYIYIYDNRILITREGDKVVINKLGTDEWALTLIIFCVVNSLLTLVRAFSFAFGGLRTAVQVHDRLLKNLVNAPVQFFDHTPSGRILNRLSSDLHTIDETLPFILNILLASFVGLLGIAIVLSYVQVMFLLLLLPFWCIYNKLQFYYRSTSRELRRLDSVSRSPIYASFTEILNGSSTIRAFKSEDFFFSRFIEKVLLYQRTSYSANLWLSLRLQLLAAVIVCFVVVMAVVGSHGHLLISFGSPGKVGLALSYAAPIVSLLGNFLTSFTET